MIRKIKDWISDIDWKYYGICALIILGLIAVGIIHYYVFIKPAEDAVDAEWREKYEEMMEKHEYEIEELKEDYQEQIWKLESDIDDLNKEVDYAYDSGYDYGYSDGYADGYSDGENGL